MMMRTVNYKNPAPVAVKTKVENNTNTANLYFNLIRFSWPDNNVIHYFSLTVTENSKKLHKSLFPKELSKIFSPKELDTDFIYTTQGYPQEGFKSISINLSTTTLDYAKLHFRNKLKYYFKKKAEKIVEIGFIDNIIIWEWCHDQPTDAPFVLFDKFSLRVVIESEKQRTPCLLISYEGKSKILKDEINTSLIKVPSGSVKKVKYKNSIMSYKHYTELDEVESEMCNPIAHPLMYDAYNIPHDSNLPSNKYLKYKTKIDQFYKDVIYQEEVINFFGLSDKGFIQVPMKSMGLLDAEISRLYYEDDASSTDMPKRKFKNLKPAVRVKGRVIVFFVYHSEDKESMELWKSYIKNGYTYYYSGLNGYSSMNGEVVDIFDMIFENKENPLPELQLHYDRLTWAEPGTKCLPLYVTPFSREETYRQQVRVMPLVKEFFAERGMAIQSAEPANIHKSDFHWSLTTMSATIVAKLGGIPWCLKESVKTQLVIGVGAFMSDDGATYLGASVCFDNSGFFKTHDWFEKTEIKDMAGYISIMVSQYTTTYGIPDRLVIHFYKKLKKDDIIIIEKQLQSLELSKPIPIYIVSINKTEETDFVAFDMSKPKLLMPETGTYVELFNNQYLLYNNARVGDVHNASDHYHFPIKLHIQGNKQAELDLDTTKELIEQVFQYSKLNYRTLAQQNLPVTLLAVELLADYVPYFNHKRIPDAVKHLPWFL